MLKESLLLVVTLPILLSGITVATWMQDWFTMFLFDRDKFIEMSGLSAETSEREKLWMALRIFASLIWYSVFGMYLIAPTAYMISAIVGIERDVFDFAFFAIGLVMWLVLGVSVLIVLINESIEKIKLDEGYDEGHEEFVNRISAKVSESLQEMQNAKGGRR